MKFSALAGTTSLLALALAASAQVADPAAATSASLLTDTAAAATSTAVATDTAALTDGTSSTDAAGATDASATDATALGTSTASGLKSTATGTSSVIASGAPAAPGGAGLPVVPVGGPPINSVRPSGAIAPVATSTATPQRPTFLPSLTGTGASTFSTKNAAPNPIGVASQGTVYAVLGAIIAAMF